MSLGGKCKLIHTRKNSPHAMYTAVLRLGRHACIANLQLFAACLCVPSLTALTGPCFALPGILHNHRASLILLHRLYYVYHWKNRDANVRQRLKRIDLKAQTKDLLIGLWLLDSVDL